ncbi:unnamed protein product [Prunus armeniaca]
MDIAPIMRYLDSIGSDYRELESRELESRILLVNDYRELSDWKSEVVGPPRQVDQYGKFVRSVDHKSSETVSSFVKYSFFAYSTGRVLSRLGSIRLGASLGFYNVICDSNSIWIWVSDYGDFGFGDIGVYHGAIDRDVCACKTYFSRTCIEDSAMRV